MRRHSGWTPECRRRAVRLRQDDIARFADPRPSSADARIACSSTAFRSAGSVRRHFVTERPTSRSKPPCFAARCARTSCHGCPNARRRAERLTSRTATLPTSGRIPRDRRFQSPRPGRASLERLIRVPRVGRSILRKAALASSFVRIDPSHYLPRRTHSRTSARKLQQVHVTRFVSLHLRDPINRRRGNEIRRVVAARGHVQLDWKKLRDRLASDVAARLAEVHRDALSSAAFEVPSSNRSWKYRPVRQKLGLLTAELRVASSGHYYLTGSNDTARVIRETTFEPPIKRHAPSVRVCRSLALLNAASTLPRQATSFTHGHACDAYYLRDRSCRSLIRTFTTGC